MKIEKVALIGLGAMGTYFAPGLFRGLKENFCVIAEGERKKRIEEEGTIVNNEKFFFPVRDGEHACTMDVIFIATKYGALSEVKKAIAPFVGPNTILISVLNGVDSEEILGEEFGKDHMIYSFMKISGVRVGNTITYEQQKKGFYFGEAFTSQKTDRVKALEALLEECGIGYYFCENILKDQWFKYACNIGENQVQAVLGVPYGAFHDNTNANHVREMAMVECMEVAVEKGIFDNMELSGMLEKQREILKKLPKENKTSMLQDIEQGRTTEVEMFAGNLIRMARELGMEVPVNEFLYYSIKTLEDRNLGKF